MRKNTVCFTGHSTVTNIEKLKIRIRLRRVLIESIEKGYCYFGAGGALGFDTIAAKVVLKLRKKYTHIKLILVLPCKTQTLKWDDSDIRTYEKIKKLADKVVYTSEDYYSGCMHKRNRHLIDNSSLCICYLKKDSGGTAYTVKYAEANGLKVINLANKNYMQ